MSLLPGMTVDSPGPHGDADRVVLDVDCVSKRFSSGRRLVQALQEVSLKAYQGRVTGLIGPDGAGKTTLMRLIAGLLIPDAGRIMVLDMDVSRSPLAVQASIGYMPQRFGLYEDLSVQENLDLYADLQGVPQADRPDRYDGLMHMTGLGDFLTRMAGRLSGGMKQKLGLACTLIRSPELLLLDEPTVGVDPVSRRELWEIVYRLVRQDHMSVLLTTSYLDEAQRCNHVVMIHDGRVLDDGPPERFNRRMAGRTYAASVPGIKKRHTQQWLASRPGVTAAVIDGDRIRLVLAEGVRPQVQALLPGVTGASLEAVEPRFEDGFVAILRDRHAAGHAQPQLQPPRPPAGEVPSETVIEVRDLQRRFGDFYAVKGISFDVGRGEIFGLLGANGAGKSTTFRMLCGLLPASAGMLRVAGVDLRTASAAARARIGYMSQKFSLYGNLTVRQNLAFFSSAYGLAGRRRASRIAWAMEHFELEPYANDDSGGLPLGYKQRLAMACAIMHEPDILFLDEPTSGVDPLARREFWQRINDLADRGVTVLVTTHFMAEAEYCDRVAIMAAGEILALATPQEIRRQAATPDRPDPSMEDAFIDLIELDGRDRRDT